MQINDGVCGITSILFLFLLSHGARGGQQFQKLLFKAFKSLKRFLQKIIGKFNLMYWLKE